MSVWYQQNQNEFTSAFIPARLHDRSWKVHEVTEHVSDA